MKVFTEGLDVEVLEDPFYSNRSGSKRFSRMGKTDGLTYLVQENPAEADPNDQGKTIITGNVSMRGETHGTYMFRMKADRHPVGARFWQTLGMTRALRVTQTELSKEYPFSGDISFIDGQPTPDEGVAKIVNKLYCGKQRVIDIKTV